MGMSWRSFARIILLLAAFLGAIRGVGPTRLAGRYNLRRAY
jgi:hypothetical protein